MRTYTYAHKYACAYKYAHVHAANIQYMQTTDVAA